MGGDSIKRGPCAPNHVIGDGGPDGDERRARERRRRGQGQHRFPGAPHASLQGHRASRYGEGRVLRSRDLVRPRRRLDVAPRARERCARASRCSPAQNTYHIGRPTPARQCETRFGYAPKVDGAIAPDREVLPRGRHDHAVQLNLRRDARACALVKRIRRRGAKCRVARSPIEHGCSRRANGAPVRHMVGPCNWLS